MKVRLLTALASRFQQFLCWLFTGHTSVLRLENNGVVRLHCTNCFHDSPGLVTGEAGR